MLEKQRLLQEVENELMDMTEEEKQDVLTVILKRKNKGAA